MNDKHESNSTGPTPGSPESFRPSQYELWFDGLLDEAASRREHARVTAAPLLRARFEADRAIEESLRRSYGAKIPARALPSASPSSPSAVDGTRMARPSVRWRRYAIAAGVVAMIGAALAITWKRRDSRGGTPQQLVVKPPTKASAKSTIQLVANDLNPRSAPHLRAAQYSLGDVFLDALALDFQPLLGCQAQDPWDAELFAQLADAPCNRDEGVVVLGEWVDPRLDVADMLMLRRGENPIMLVVPRCEEDTELCVPKDSGLYVHRGMRDGRTIYEISPVSGSEVLGCVEAKDVVTQQQF